MEQELGLREPETVKEPATAMAEKATPIEFSTPPETASSCGKRKHKNVETMEAEDQGGKLRMEGGG